MCEGGTLDSGLERKFESVDGLPLALAHVACALVLRGVPQSWLESHE